MSEYTRVLEPITPAAPCGTDLSFSTEFDAIQEARREDDPSLDQGDWITSIKVADWRAVSSICVDLLSTKSKDIRLGVWLVEALAKRDGMAGYARGVDLLAGLCERYWDCLHPRPDDGDQEQRIGNLGWLIARTVDLTREMPITDASNGAFTFNDLESARARQAMIDRDPKQGSAVVADRVTLAQIVAAQHHTRADFYRDLLDSANAATIALEHLESLVDARLGADGPSFASAREALKSHAHAVRLMARNVGIAHGEDASAGAETALSVNCAGLSATGTVASREQALAQLRLVAEFFRRTEPHSPVAYLAERAARWGEMPLHQWLKHVLKDEASLTKLEELLGIERPVTSDDGPA